MAKAIVLVWKKNKIDNSSSKLILKGALKVQSNVWWNLSYSTFGTTQFLHQSRITKKFFDITLKCCNKNEMVRADLLWKYFIFMFFIKIISKQTLCKTSLFIVVQWQISNSPRSIRSYNANILFSLASFAFIYNV